MFGTAGKHDGSCNGYLPAQRFQKYASEYKKERSDSVSEKRRQRESTKQTIEVIEQVILV